LALIDVGRAARATGLNKSRVDQIIREMADRYPSLRLTYELAGIDAAN
jgi:hypothetical protein